MTTKLDEMWAALEAYQPTPEYADAWRRFLERDLTFNRLRAAYWAAPVGSAAAAAAVYATLAARAVSVAEADDYAQRAIDAIKEVKP